MRAGLYLPVPAVLLSIQKHETNKTSLEKCIHQNDYHSQKAYEKVKADPEADGSKARTRTSSS
jgi:hypothetical protein